MDFSGIIATVIGVGQIIALVIMGLILLGFVAVGVWIYQNNKSYSKYKVVVYEMVKTQDGKEMPLIVSTKERGRVWYDKKMKRHYFEMKDAKARLGEEELKSYDEDRDLDVPHIPCSSGGYYVFIRRLGVRKYAFGEAFAFEGNIKVIVSHADVAEGIRAFDMNAKTFGKKDHTIWVVAGYIVICVLILILIIVVLNKFDTLKEVANNFNSGANAILQSKQAAVPSSAPH